MGGSGVTANIYEPLDEIFEALDGGATVIVCAGPPSCPFTGDAAIASQEAGCPKCLRIDIAPDGTETEYQTKAQ